MENKVSKTILEELKRYNQINSYIVEQDAALPPPPADEDPTAAEPPPPAPDDTTLGGATPPEGEAAPETGAPIDINNDPDVEEIETGDSEGGKNDGGTEELEDEFGGGGLLFGGKGPVFGLGVENMKEEMAHGCDSKEAHL